MQREGERYVYQDISRVRAMKGRRAAVKKAKGGNFKEGGDKKATKAMKKAKWSFAGHYQALACA